MLALQYVALLLKVVQLITQNDGVDAGLDALDESADLALDVIKPLAGPLNVTAGNIELAAGFRRKTALEPLKGFPRQQALFQGVQHRALHQAPVDLEAVRACRRAAVLVLGAAVPVAVHDDVIGPTLRTLQQPTEQVLRAGAGPCLLAGRGLLQLALIGNGLLPRLDFRPHVDGHDTQLGYLCDHPYRLIVWLAGALAGIRIGHEPGTVPNVAAVVQGVVQNAAAILGVTVNRRACPSAAAGRRHAFFVQFRRNRHWGVPVSEHPMDSPDNDSLFLVD